MLLAIWRLENSLEGFFGAARYMDPQELAAYLGDEQNAYARACQRKRAAWDKNRALRTEIARQNIKFAHKWNYPAPEAPEPVEYCPGCFLPVPLCGCGKTP